MTALGNAGWPPDPIETKRLLLRPTRASDRASYIDLQCSDVVYRYLGGPKLREVIEREVPDVPGNRPGVFGVEALGSFIGIVTLGRRDQDRPGHLQAQGNELEISYLFLPSYWSHGYATEAASAVLDWLEQVQPEEPVVLCTQVANGTSVRLAQRLGFREAGRFMEFDAEQWFGVRHPGSRPPA